jgi:hypothetical protein
MAAENDFLPIAATPTANVDTQADYAGAGYQLNGFTPGQTLSTQFNKTLRQGSMGMAVLAQFIVNVLNVNVLDQGYASAAAEVSALVAQFEAALTTYISGAGVTPSVVVVAYSTTPAFNAAAGSILTPVFQITLTGNVVSSTLTGVLPGQFVTFIIKQDGSGGHTFAWPAGVNNSGAIDATAGSVSVQSFVADSTGALQAVTGITG